MSRAARFAVAIPLLLGAIARLVAFLSLQSGNPFAEHLFSDSHHYWQWAAAIRAGDAPAEAFYQAPLYPYLLALWRTVAGDSLPMLYAWQHALGLLTVALIHRFGRRLGYGAGATIAASLYAVHPYPIYFEQKVLGETWAAPLALVAAAVLAAPPRRVSGAFGGGVLVGLACLAKANLLLFAVLALLRLAFAVRPGGRVLAAYLAGLVLVVAPVAARNQFVDGGFTLVAANGGEVFYHGNNGNAAGSMGLIPGLDADIESLPVASRRAASARAGRELNAAEASRFWFGEGIAWIRANPAAWAGLLAQKTRLLVSGGFTPLSAFYDFEYERFGGWPRAFRFVHYPLLLLGVAAFVWRPARDRFPAPFRLLAATPAIAILIFFACTRYTLVMIPPLAIGSGAVIAAVIAGRRARRTVALVLAGGIVLFALADRPARAVRATPYVQLAGVHQQRGDFDRARALYREAMALRPGDPRHRALIAKTYELEGDRGRALAELEAAIRDGVADAQTYAYRAFLCLELGEYRRAEEALLEAGARDPENPDLLRMLFRLYSGPLADEEKARRVFEKLVQVLQERGEPVITSPGPPGG